jgi:serine O-acetyltransferase
MSFKADVFADYEAARRNEVRANWVRVLVGFLQYAGFRGMLLYRIGNWARRRRLRAVYRLVERVLQIFCGLNISTGAEIGGGLALPHPRTIIIGDRSKVGRRGCILQGVTLGGSGRKKPDGQSQPHIGDDVLIGAGAVLVGPIQVGNRVRVGANAVVTRDLPDDCTVVGNPMRIVRIGDRRVGLLEQDDELSHTLRDLARRVAALEAHLYQLGQDGESANRAEFADG